ncbi:MAG: LytTR family DNA-binding domain-containing protein, partial [Bacteroidota bacterium]
PKEVEYLEQFVFVKSDKILHRVDFQTIIYVQAEGDFVRVITTETKHFLSNTLKYWTSILPERHFLQVHRSYLINISKIESIRGNEIITKAGKVPVGRSFKNKLLETIEKIGSQN